jgi:hypothetical protein
MGIRGTAEIPGRTRWWLLASAVFLFAGPARAQAVTPPGLTTEPPPLAPVPTQVAPPPPPPPPDPGVQALVQSAQASSAAALLAPSASESKSQAKAAQAVSDQVQASASATPQQKAAAAKSVTAAQQSVTNKQTSESLCGAVDSTATDSAAHPRSVCFVYGLFAASLSFVNVDGEGSGTGSVFSGQSNHHLASIAVPFAGVRLLPQVWAGVDNWGFLSIDISGYSAFLSQNLGTSSPTSSKAACSSTNSDFAQRLPCEANATVTPYLGAYVGVTVGKSGLAYLTLIPFTFGMAQVGVDSGLHVYSGWSVGALQINGSL